MVFVIYSPGNKQGVEIILKRLPLRGCPNTPFAYNCTLQLYITVEHMVLNQDA
jgi:hypothetical protein